MHTITNNSPLLAYSSLSKEDLARAKKGLIKQPDGTYQVTPAYSGGNGSEYVGLLLPNTQMHLTIPLVYYQNAVASPAQVVTNRVARSLLAAHAARIKSMPVESTSLIK